MKMTHEAEVLKPQNADLLAILAEVQSYLGAAAQTGTALHEVEHAVWKHVLRLGAALLGQFLALLGTGDLGPSVTLPDGGVPGADGALARSQQLAEPFGVGDKGRARRCIGLRRLLVRGPVVLAIEGIRVGRNRSPAMLQGVV